MHLERDNWPHDSWRELLTRRSAKDLGLGDLAVDYVVDYYCPQLSRVTRKHESRGMLVVDDPTANLNAIGDLGMQIRTVRKERRVHLTYALGPLRHESTSSIE